MADDEVPEWGVLPPPTSFAQGPPTLSSPHPSGSTIDFGQLRFWPISRVILAHMCVRLWCASVCVTVWVHFGSILCPFCVHLVSILCPFGFRLGSTWGPFGVRVGSMWGPFGVHSGSIRGPFGVHSGSIRGSFWVHLAYCLNVDAS